MTKQRLTRNIRYTRLRIVPVTDNHSIINLIPTNLTSLLRPHLPPTTIHLTHKLHLGLQPHKLSDSKLAGEVLEIHQHLSVTREPPRVPTFVVFLGHKRVVPETHNFSGEIGSEGLIEARLHHRSTRVEPKWVRLDLGSVDPGAPDLVPMLEHHDFVAFTTELPGRDEAGRASADHGHVAGHRGMESGWQGYVLKCAH